MPPKPRSIIAFAVISALSVIVVWAFPFFWFTKTGPEKPIWFLENTNVTGWNYKSQPISTAEEAQLQADKSTAGEFSKDRDRVTVFSAKRFSNDPNEIGLFGHTPDRCWTESGWRLQLAAPDTISVNVHGMTIPFERRIFVWKTGQRLLVYFTGLNAGQPLPYRLNHHLSIAQQAELRGKNRAGLLERNTNGEQVNYIWNVFKSRRQIVGPKHFLRIATELSRDGDSEADKRIQSLLEAWLQPGDFEQELTKFNESKVAAR